MVDYSSAVGRAWKFATNLNRAFVLFILYIIGVGLIAAPFIFLASSVASSGAITAAMIISAGAWLLLALVIGGLILIYSSLLITHNYANQKSLSASSGFARANYLRFLAASIIVIIISAVVSVVPVLGVLFAIVASLAFFFYQQEIAVSKSGVSESIGNSYHLFVKNWVDVIITAIINVVLSLIIIGIFAIPMLASFLVVVGNRGHVVAAMLANVPLFAVTGLILVFGIAFATLLTTGIKTDVYQQLKKRKK